MFELTADEERDFYHRGFFIRTDVFNQSEITEISSALDVLYALSRLLEQTTVLNGTQFVLEKGVLRRAVWCGAAQPVLLNYSQDRRITVAVSALLRSREAQHLICQAHFKMPGDGVGFRWHQDSENRGYGTSDWTDVNGTGSYVQTLIAVDPMTNENGPILFAPGSCKRGHLGLNQMEDPSLAFDSKTLISLLVSPGAVAFVGPYTIHGSLPNSSSAPRRIFINGYACPNANKRKYPGVGSGRMLELR